jgi:hypothetical protein
MKRFWQKLRNQPGAAASDALSSEASALNAAPRSTSSLASGKARRLGRELGLWSALGVFAAALLAVSVNLLVARHYRRWDVTSAELYTLSGPSLETLAALSEPVQLLVFLGRADPEFPTVQRLLDQYAAESRQIEVSYVDPDRQPAEFLALQNRYRLSQGRAEQGHVVSDAAIVVIRGDARWVIGGEDIISYDDERGTVQPRLEQAVTEGIRQVLEPKRTEVCVTRGQEEASIDDGGPTGLGGLRYTLEKNNYTVREVDLTGSGSELALAKCDLIVVAAPGEAFSAPATARLVAAARHGKSFLLAFGPNLDEENHTIPSGLEPLLDVFGVRASQQLIFERDPDLALPLGVGGEAFLASPKPHAITRGLVKNGEARQRVLVQLAEGLESVGAAAPLLVTSSRAFAVNNAAALATPGASLDGVQHSAEGPFVVGMAAELPRGASTTAHVASKNAAAPVRAEPEAPPARLVALGSASPLLGTTFQDASLAGTRRFVESALSWVVARPTLVSLADKPERQVDLHFTEQALGQVSRYVLLYMPATALALGILVLFRRRSGRASAEEGGARS